MKEEIKTLIEKKCVLCFRKDECMLFSERHAGIELCLGPFKNDKDRLRKVNEDSEMEKKKSKHKVRMDKAVMEMLLDTYSRNKKIFSSSEIHNNDDSDDK